MIAFEEITEHVDILLPGASAMHRVAVAYRRDPLTGHLSVYTRELSEKARMFFGETDEAMILDMAEKSRPNCFFCPENVMKVTPDYPRTFISTGKLTGKDVVLFPNLFPLARVHAVVTSPSRHHLAMSDFSQAYLDDIFEVSQRFLRRVRDVHPDIGFISINVNHLPPAGASLFHPHFQIFGHPLPPSKPAREARLLHAYREAHGRSFWVDLAEAEAPGPRWIGSTGKWAWLTVFSPGGPNEIIGIHLEKPTMFHLEAADYSALGDALSRILGFLHQQGYSSFNFSLAGGLRNSGNDGRCVARIITRQNFRPAYRSDDYFLQKFLGMELIIQTPEELAGAIKKRF